MSAQVGAKRSFAPTCVHKKYLHLAGESPSIESLPEKSPKSCKTEKVTHNVFSGMYRQRIEKANKRMEFKQPFDSPKPTPKWARALDSAIARRSFGCAHPAGEPFQ